LTNRNSALPLLFYTARCSSQPYIGEHICIKNETSHPFQAFVSKYSNSNGSDAWYNVPNEWNDSGKWSRGYWELVAIRNNEDTHRNGAYVSAKNQTVYITIKGVTNLEIICTPKPY
jgi:hypothetical protein